MWKRKRWKRQIFVEEEAEAKSGKKGTACPSNLTIYIEHQNSNVVQFFKKYMTKSDCLIDRHLQRNIFKGFWFT